MKIDTATRIPGICGVGRPGHPIHVCGKKADHEGRHEAFHATEGGPVSVASWPNAKGMFEPGTRMPWKDRTAETYVGFRGLVEALSQAEEQYPEQHRWRRGEIAFYALVESRPDLAEQIRGEHDGVGQSGRDPAKYDANLPAFWAWLKKAWDAEPLAPGPWIPEIGEACQVFPFTDRNAQWVDAVRIEPLEGDSEILRFSINKGRGVLYLDRGSEHFRKAQPWVPACGERCELLFKGEWIEAVRTDKSKRSEEVIFSAAIGRSRVCIAFRTDDLGRFVRRPAHSHDLDSVTHPASAPMQSLVLSGEAYATAARKPSDGEAVPPAFEAKARSAPPRACDHRNTLMPVPGGWRCSECAAFVPDTAGLDEGEPAPTTPPHPMQPLALDSDGTLRFKSNGIVRYLLDFASPRGCSLNELACLPFSQEDREQFAQLIGYSLCEFKKLIYVRDETYETAKRMWETGGDDEQARIAVLEAALAKVRDGLRPVAAELFGVRPEALQRSDLALEFGATEGEGMTEFERNRDHCRDMHEALALLGPSILGGSPYMEDALRAKAVFATRVADGRTVHEALADARAEHEKRLAERKRLVEELVARECE